MFPLSLTDPVWLAPSDRGGQTGFSFSTIKKIKHPPYHIQLVLFLKKKESASSIPYVAAH